MAHGNKNLAVLLVRRGRCRWCHLIRAAVFVSSVVAALVPQVSQHLRRQVHLREAGQQVRQEVVRAIEVGGRVQGKQVGRRRVEVARRRVQFSSGTLASPASKPWGTRRSRSTATPLALLSLEAAGFDDL